MTPGKKTALVTGAIVGLILASLVALWKDLAVAYRISELRGDPALMAAWIPEPEDSVRGIALRRYARTAHGIEALRRHCLAFLFDLLAAKNPEFLPGALSAGQIVQLGVYEVTPSQSYILADGPRTLALPVPAEAKARLDESERALFGFATPGEFDLAEHPGVRFTAWTYREDGEGRPQGFEVQMVRHPPRPARTPDRSSREASDTGRTAHRPPTDGTERR